MSVDLPLLSINESILIVGMLINSPPCLPKSSLRRNLRVGLIIAHLEIGGLDIQLMFNENIIELGDDKEYIEEAADAIVMLHVK